MRMLIVLCGVLLLVGCYDSDWDKLEEEIVKRTYASQEHGYRCAMAGWTLEECQAMMEEIIGSPPPPETIDI